MFLSLQEEFQGASAEQYKLVICEKPLAAKRISEVLGTRKLIKKEPLPGVVIFEIVSKSDQRFIVCSALGHLYNLFPLEKNRKKYPIYDVKWSPRHSIIARERRRILQTLMVISNISKGASEFIHACDYDLEGELIGYNILQYACKNKYKVSKRAKFSSLTDTELNRSFDNLQSTNIRIADAGIARHLIDFIFGINLSRALVNCVNVSNQINQFHNLTIGRVQGPTLGFIVNKEVNIRNHIPDPLWYITGKFEKSGSFFKANLEKVIHKFSDIEKILSECKNETGIIKQIVQYEKEINPPTPFNITNLQKEAYRIFKITPLTTLSIAESLYLAALISYPRTSSQKLPPSIGYKQIIKQLSLNYDKKYENVINDLLKRKYLVPYQGKEEDPAHPAIYPTGVKKKKLNVFQQKILDLIIRRFLSTFGNNAITKYTEVIIDVNGHDFISKGNTIVKNGWISIYKPYFIINESILPEFSRGEFVKVDKIAATQDFTKPTPRYNQASLLDKMDIEGIGTKSTRAEIINLLIKRKYMTQDKNVIVPTELGFTIVNTMKNYVSEIVSTKLTKLLESRIEKIEEGDLNLNDVRDYLKKSLEGPLNKIKKNECAIGDELKNILSLGEDRIAIGKCPKCLDGKMIMIKSSKSNRRYVVCSQYRVTGCNAIASVPQTGFIKKSNNVCSCGWPTIIIMYPRRKLWRICVNRTCPQNKYNKINSHHDLNTSI
ncbi:MAG: DNA topoisomerase I [Thaumarchaeota archaeon]|nr:MAG: DNA topoisomerase I [Nitrososphaerota archaeon]